MIPTFSNEMQVSKMFNILLTAGKVHRFVNIYVTLVNVSQK